MKSKFESELSSLINRYRIENESNTPDFILSSYLIECLNTFNKAIKQREKWYGRLTDREDNINIILSHEGNSNTGQI